MQAAIFIGIQATGKSSFFKERFFQSHVRINYDMLKTRRKERLLLQACLAMPHPFVIDNTNPRRADRAEYLRAAKAAGFEIVGYYFRSVLEEALARNRQRLAKARVPDAGLRGTAAKLELPSYAEGFDQLFYVSLDPGGLFTVSLWEEPE